MGKKNIFIGLSTLLLVLLLGSFTVTYADSNRTWDSDDVKNIIYNFYIDLGSKTDSETTAFITNNSTLIDDIVVKLNSVDNIIVTNVSSGTNSGFGLVFMCSAHANPQYYQSSRNGNNFLNVNNRNSNDILYYFNYQFQTGSRTNLADVSSQVYNNTFLYTSTSIRSASPTGSILFDVGYYSPSDFFDGPYSVPPRPQPYIEPYPYYDLGSMLIYNVTLPAYEFVTTGLHDQGLTKMRFATAFNPNDYKIVHYGVGYYTYVKPYDRWDLETLANSADNWHGFDNWQIKGNSIVGYNSSFNSETGYWETLILINNKYVHANCVYDIQLEAIPLEDTDSGETINTVFMRLPMYLTDSHTVIDSNGELDTDATFTNDYYLDYRTDIEDLNKQINDITGITDVINSEITDVPPVDDLLGYGLFSGDMYYLAGNLGYVNRSNHYWDFLYLYTYNLCQVLLQDSDPYFDFRLHGEETAYRIYSHDIGLPDGHPLKVFVSLFFLFGFIWIIYYQFKSIVEAIQTANMPKVAHLEDADLYFFKM